MKLTNKETQLINSNPETIGNCDRVVESLEAQVAAGTLTEDKMFFFLSCGGDSGGGYFHLGTLSEPCRLRIVERFKDRLEN